MKNKLKKYRKLIRAGKIQVKQYFYSTIISLVIMLSVQSSWGNDKTDKETTKKVKAKKEQESKYREIAKQIKLFGEVYREVSRRYVEQIDPEEFISAAIDGMLETLDPYTVFYEPEQRDALEIMTQGEYGGVGIEISLRGKNKELTVIAPIDDTPAARKGVRAGDVIVKVEGKSTAGFSTKDASKLIRGKAGTDVTITIRRPSQEELLDYTLERAEIRIHDVAYAGMLDDEIAYIKLVKFSSRAGQEFQTELIRLMKNDPTGLILDLRSNPGGLLKSAVQVSQSFLQPDDNIVSMRGRQPRSNREFTASKPPIAENVPLVVLINSGSASASEIVSGAIQDHDRGVIIGKPTFGKGLVQTVYNLSHKSAVKVTTARYYTPSGRLIQRDRSDPDENEMGTDLEMLNTVTEVDTARKYYTRAGREVFGGGGISPDLEIESRVYPDVAVEMFRKDLFFGFVNQWFTHHQRMDTVQLTESMVDSFYVYMEYVEFEQSVIGSGSLDELRQIGDKDSLDDGYFELINQLELQLSNSNNLHNPEVREFIRQSLDREIASNLGGRVWRIRSTFDEDPLLSEAKDILLDPIRYQSLLQSSHRSDLGDGKN